MCFIAESNVLLRAQIELPAGLKVATQNFRQGWERMRTGGVSRLEKRMQARGWNFIRVADGALRSGVGDTPQLAIAGALTLALLAVGSGSNAVEVERVELTQYPWFYLARVCVHPYRIQESAELSAAVPSPTIAPAQQAPLKRRRSPAKAADLFPQFGSAMPMLKSMLTVSRMAEMRAQ